MMEGISPEICSGQKDILFVKKITDETLKIEKLLFPRTAEQISGLIQASFYI